MRESRSLGSVGAKAEWLSYPTATQPYSVDNPIGPAPGTRNPLAPTVLPLRFQFYVASRTGRIDRGSCQDPALKMEFVGGAATTKADAILADVSGRLRDTRSERALHVRLGNQFPAVMAERDLHFTGVWSNSDGADPRSTAHKLFFEGRRLGRG